MQVYHGSGHGQRAGKFDSCLIVEDSIFDQRRLFRILHRNFEGMTIRIATTVGEARKFLNRNHVSLILLDNNLPDGIGANLALELARDIRFSDTVIIMVSDWPTPFMFDKVHDAGVEHVVSKSEFDISYIRNAIDSKHGGAPLH